MLSAVAQAESSLFEADAAEAGEPSRHAAFIHSYRLGAEQMAAEGAVIRRRAVTESKRQQAAKQQKRVSNTSVARGFH